ncbi:Hypothetical predicted protein [Xyrichtys novacula]|uniref:Uncharacterized protein n=1 Tax=Xyrichtys novacula TaxID=13765 RepID=A0AAV1F9M8_XYRNO|nr:Hypothetical predicted protein [Xyrichtys novacula]
MVPQWDQRAVEEGQRQRHVDVSDDLEDSSSCQHSGSEETVSRRQPEVTDIQVKYAGNDRLRSLSKHSLASVSNQNRFRHIFWKHGNSSDSHEDDIDTFSAPHQQLSDSRNDNRRTLEMSQLQRRGKHTKPFAKKTLLLPARLF